MSSQYPDTHGPEVVTVAADNSIPYKFMPQSFMRVGGFDFTIGAEAADVISITIQARDMRGRKWNGYLVFDVLFALSSLGVPNAIFADLAVTTGTLITESATDAVITVQTNADGAVVLAATKAGAYSVYCRARCGDRMVQYSSGTPLAATAITWA